VSTIHTNLEHLLLSSTLRAALDARRSSAGQ
jgi:hypothetical protein